MADGDSIKRVKHGVPIYIDVRSCGLALYACSANPDFGAIERVVRTLVQKTLKGGNKQLGPTKEPFMSIGRLVTGSHLPDLFHYPYLIMSLNSLLWLHFSRLVVCIREKIWTLVPFEK